MIALRSFYPLLRSLIAPLQHHVSIRRQQFQRTQPTASCLRLACQTDAAESTAFAGQGGDFQNVVVTFTPPQRHPARIAPAHTRRAPCSLSRVSQAPRPPPGRLPASYVAAVRLSLLSGYFTGPNLGRRERISAGTTSDPADSQGETTTPDPLSRRRFVGTMAASLAATWIAGPATPGFASAGRVLAPGQLRDLDTIAALILPSDDTPGAREAHVVDFIDRALASFATDQRPLFDAGLADLGARAARRHPLAGGFADLPEADAVALLRELEAERSDFFEAARVATISGFLANPEYGGNAAKAGWRAIGFDDRFVWAEPFGWYDGEGAAGE